MEPKTTLFKPSSDPKFTSTYSDPCQSLIDLNTLFEQYTFIYIFVCLQSPKAVQTVFTWRLLLFPAMQSQFFWAWNISVAERTSSIMTIRSSNLVSWYWKALNKKFLSIISENKLRLLTRLLKNTFNKENISTNLHRIWVLDLEQPGDQHAHSHNQKV